MNPRIFNEFQKILSARSVGQSVLEIGAVPSPDSLLNLPALKEVPSKIGINLDAGESYKNVHTRGNNNDVDFQILQANGNNMDCFEDDKFDTVLCNAVFEHDKFFWKTVSEIRRVVKEGGLVVIGAPGYDKLSNIQLENPGDDSLKQRIKRLVLKLAIRWEGNYHTDYPFGGETATLAVHNWPGDYYRFSVQAFKEVIFEGMREVEVRSVMIPPRIIGIGYNVK